MDKKKNTLKLKKYCARKHSGDVENSTLKKVEVIKLYNCFHGKKIWDLSESQKYSSNCIHRSFESAAEFAERQRARGRTFYIKEMPALKLDNDKCSILITQFNENSPLKMYSGSAVREAQPAKKVKQSPYDDNCLAAGAPMDAVLSSFNSDSFFWKPQGLDKNVALMLYVDKNISFDPLKSTKLKAWESKSAGVNKPLDWLVLASDISQSSILRIYKASCAQKIKKDSSKSDCKKSKKSKCIQRQKNLDELLLSIKNQKKNDLFFFYRTKDIGGFCGTPSKFWVEKNSGCYDKAGDYLLYCKSPKRGLEIFQIEVSTYEITCIPGMYQEEKAA